MNPPPLPTKPASPLPPALPTSVTNPKRRLGCVFWVVMVFVGLLALGFVCNHLDARNWKQTKNRLIPAMEKAIAAEDFDKALDLAKPYKEREDPQFQKLVSVAEKGKKTAHIKQLETDASSISARTRKEAIRQLAIADPDNQKFKNEIRELKKKQARSAKVRSLFSSWDGSNRKINQMIKSSMHDPDSFKHVQTRHWLMGENVIVVTSFRGKNGFGGVVTQSIKVEMDIEGNILKVLSQG